MKHARCAPRRRCLSSHLPSPGKVASLRRMAAPSVTALETPNATGSVPVLILASDGSYGTWMWPETSCSAMGCPKPCQRTPAQILTQPKTTKLRFQQYFTAGVKVATSPRAPDLQHVDTSEPLHRPGGLLRWPLCPQHDFRTSPPRAPCRGRIDRSNPVRGANRWTTKPASQRSPAAKRTRGRGRR